MWEYRKEVIESKDIEPKDIVKEMDKFEIDELEQRLKKATSWWYFFSKFMDIKLGKIKYTNDDIDELIEYYEKKEQYKLCEKLMVLKK